MAQTHNPSADTVTIELQFSIGGERVQAKIPVPAGPTRPRIMLPVFQALGDLVVGQAVKAVEQKGQSISCKAGCGACCRQLVPITPTETYNLRDVIEAMPEPRRSEIRARFAEARRKLEEAGLLDRLLKPETIGSDVRAVGMEYFRLGIACPFLEAESCSIYPDRPIACREYVVTSPAEECAAPAPEKVACVPMPAKVSAAVADLGVTEETRFTRWVPLVLAPEWTESHPEETAERTGPDLLKELFERLGKRCAPSPVSDTR
jgi:Fe-S-cluster containining protein